MKVEALPLPVALADASGTTSGRASHALFAVAGFAAILGAAAVAFRLVGQFPYRRVEELSTSLADGANEEAACEPY
jgi:hypothetical protein